MTVGRHELSFHTRANIQRMPTRWHETAGGRFKVSTPELTALELVQRDAQVGGIARVREVLRSLCESCSVEGLQEALDAAQEVPAAQRLGALLCLQGRAELAQGVQHWLQGRKIRAILNVPRIQWPHYAANRVASLCRESNGLIWPRIDTNMRDCVRRYIIENAVSDFRFRQNDGIGIFRGAPYSIIRLRGLVLGVMIKKGR